jgi:hypothetical protein
MFANCKNYSNNIINLKTCENKMLISSEGERISYEIELKGRNIEELRQMSTNYSFEYISLFNHRTKPDIYIGECVIPASHYTILEDSLYESLEKDKLSTTDGISEIEKNSNENELSLMVYDIDYLSTQKLRYFNTSNPTKKCFKCGESGHMSINCPNNSVLFEPICFRCSMPGHKSKDCKYVKCFRCHKEGHKVSECKEKNLVKCSKCLHFGHEAIDCLLSPVPLKKDPKEIHCILCNSEVHFSLENQNATLKKIFILDNLKEEHGFRKIKSDLDYNKALIPCCPKCAGAHNYNECNSRKNYNLKNSLKYEKIEFLNQKRRRGYD